MKLMELLLGKYKTPKCDHPDIIVEIRRIPIKKGPGHIPYRETVVTKRCKICKQIIE